MSDHRRATVDLRDLGNVSRFAGQHDASGIDWASLAMIDCKQGVALVANKSASQKEIAA